jgi:glycine oxidase
MRIIVIGGGVIGLSIAWRAAQRGLDVTLFDPRPGAGASLTAAGMLAPVTELHFEGRELLALNLESAARYPAFATELADVTGMDVGLRRCGTIAVAWDAADLASMRQLHAFQRTLGVESALLTSRELREFEPALAAGLPGGLWAEDDHQVDNRKLHAALLAAAQSAGVTFVPATVTALLRSTSPDPRDFTDVAGLGAQDPGNFTEVIGLAGGRPDDIREVASILEAGPGERVSGVVTSAGERFDGDVVVLAAGSWSRGIDGLGVEVPVRPVKGQTLRLRAAPGTLGHVVRGSVKGNPVYAVPRADGEIVIGASSEEAGFDVKPRAGAIYELLRDAATLVPELTEAEFVEVSTSLRPGSPDNAPMIGASGVPGLMIATGHYRNGILLTPVTADEIVALIVDGRPGDIIAPFDPRRFARAKEPKKTGVPQ